jgi:O-acetyl-ADP-ribose deacetylase (regulator of RNase III)
MLTIKKGCLIEAALNHEIDILCHGANCFSVMGAGVAKLVRDYFPGAYEADKKDYRQPHEKIGDYSHHRHSPELLIMNLYTQYDFGTDYRRFEYGAFKRALESFGQDFGLVNKRIGIPWIGCGLAGGDKEIVRSILESVIDEYGGKWTIYE